MIIQYLKHTSRIDSNDVCTYLLLLLYIAFPNFCQTVVHLIVHPCFVLHRSYLCYVVIFIIFIMSCQPKVGSLFDQLRSPSLSSVCVSVATHFNSVTYDFNVFFIFCSQRVNKKVSSIVYRL